VGFHRERLGTPLVQAAVSDLVTMLFPSLYVHIRHLLHEGGRIAVGLRPSHKVSMIRRNTIGANSHLACPQGFFDDFLEGRSAANPLIEKMIDQATRAIWRRS